MNTLITDVKALLRKYPWLAETIKGAIFIIGGLISGIAIVDARIEKAVNDRVEPYRELLNALTVTQHTRGGDKAADLFLRLLEGKIQDRLRPESREILYDNFLWAATAASNPTRYSIPVRQVEAMINQSIPETPWRVNELGWYHLYTRNPAKAAEYFNRAADLAVVANDLSEAAESARGKAYLALARGDSEAAALAVRQFALASRDNTELVNQTSSFAVADYYKGLELLFDEETTKRLVRLYGSGFTKAGATMKSTLDALVQPAAKLKIENADSAKSDDPEKGTLRAVNDVH